MSMTSAATVEHRLAAAGMMLPEVAPPVSNYIPGCRFHDLVFCAGVTSEGATGTVGVDATVEDARGAARVAALRALAYLQQQIGSLDQVHGVMRLTGYVSCGPGVTDTPHVIDAASDVLTTAFGERGRHARSAVGVSSLPGGALVEVELIVALESVAGDER
ncbi:RidA family protein [Mycobacterium sp. AZCC_0083]|uniref:RidA family protein n=1 Tax=Mycobacterium sp. AZCC_0083 TaxID=2735882 RepID=UPI0017C67E1C|nr:RidA family protein [Mycobacterium sp. AZCC_0083]MBB5161238.1 enamine deaminase RidA (YjgF/YER057c/UK114 family) [Mycobacterium sp. AZCC_0083]